MSVQIITLQSIDINVNQQATGKVLGGKKKNPFYLNSFSAFGSCTVAALQAVALRMCLNAQHSLLDLSSFKYKPEKNQNQALITH